MSGLFRRTLVPLDGSTASERVLAHLPPIMSEGLAEVVLLAVSEDAVAGEAVSRYVDRVADRLCRLGLTVRRRVEVGAPVECIVTAARDESAEAILMAVSPDLGIGQSLFEDVAAGVVRTSPVPVLTMRYGPGSPETSPDLRTLMVPLDGTEESHRALPLAEALARGAGARLLLLHVRDRGREPVARTADVRHAAQESAGRGIDATALVTFGDPAEEILRMSVQEEVDLLVMSPHRRRSASYPRGSVTERVVRESAAPVLAVSASAA
ncbi:MAG TPA: universal stress protein [Planctomycetota bacterium]|nr:universal stress protein [Planctomycetota bacterium]